MFSYEKKPALHLFPLQANGKFASKRFWTETENTTKFATTNLQCTTCIVLILHSSGIVLTETLREALASVGCRKGAEKNVQLEGPFP